MKRLLFLSAMLAAGIGAFAQGTNGLVAHWNFNGNANDASGNGLNGTVTGATLTTGYNNVANNAYHFAGVDPITSVYSNISVPYDSSMNVTAYSICALVKVDSFNKQPCQASSIMWRGMEGNSDFYLMHFNDNLYDGSCGVSSPNNSEFLGSVGNMYTAGYPYSASTTFIQPNTWYCVTTTFANDTIKIYVDGVLKQSGYFPYQLQAGTSPIRMGASYGYSIASGAPYAYPFYGTMDDVKLYNRGLSASEVAQYCTGAKSTDGDTTVPTTVSDMLNADMFLLAPNPAGDYVSVILPSGNAKGHVELVNTVGQAIASQPINGGKITFMLNDYTSGMYMMRIDYNGKIFYKKFLKQ